MQGQLLWMRGVGGQAIEEGGPSDFDGGVLEVLEQLVEDALAVEQRQSWFGVAVLECVGAALRGNPVSSCQLQKTAKDQVQHSPKVRGRHSSVG